MDTALPIIPQPLLAQPLGLAEGSSTEGGFDFSALFLGLTVGAEGEAGQNPQDQNDPQNLQDQNDPQDPQGQTSLLLQATAATPESPAALLVNSDATSADGEGQMSHEATDDLLLRAGLLPFIPAAQMQEGQQGQAPLLLVESARAGLTLLPPGEAARASTQPQPFSIGKEGATGLPELPYGSQRLNGLFSFDADTEQSGLKAVKAQSLDLAQPGNMLQGQAVTSDIEQAVQLARQQLLSGPVSQNVQNIQAVQDLQDVQNLQNPIDVTEQDQHHAHVLSTQISLRYTGLRTELDMPQGNRILADRILAGYLAEQSPGQARPTSPYALAQDSGLTLPNTEFDVSRPLLATQAAAGSELFAAQAGLKGLIQSGVQNDLEQLQAQQARQAFAATISVLGTGSALQGEIQTSAVLDAQGAQELRHNILERVATEMAARLQLNQREARIQLNPPELGGLKIELIVNGDQVHARITAEVAAVGSLLKNSMSDLRQALQNQGLDLSSVQVDVSSRGDGQGEPGGHTGRNGHADQTQQSQHDGGTSKGGQQPDALSPENRGEGKTDEQQPGQAVSVPRSRGVNVRV